MPPVTNPYPKTWSTLGGFRYRSALSLIRPLGAVTARLGEDGDYVLDRDFDASLLVDGEEVALTAPRELITDLTSVPLPFRGFVGRVGPWLEAAILHDYLYVAWETVPGKEPQPRDRLFADRVMLLAMERARVGWLRRWLIYGSVRLFGAGAYRRRSDRIFADLDAPAYDTPLVLPT